MTDLKQLGQQAKEASYTLGLMDTRQKNTLLNKMAAAIEANAPRILQANVLDLEQAATHGISETMQDRLRLTEERITAMAEGIRQVATYPIQLGK